MIIPNEDKKIIPYLYLNKLSKLTKALLVFCSVLNDVHLNIQPQRPATASASKGSASEITTGICLATLLFNSFVNIS